MVDFMDNLLATEAVSEIGNFIRYKQGISTKKPTFVRTREFIKNFEENYSIKKVDFLYSLWQTQKNEQTLKDEFRTMKDLEEIICSYKPDLMLLSNADLELAEYGTSELSPKRLNQIQKFIYSIAKASIYYNDLTGGHKRYVA